MDLGVGLFEIFEVGGTEGVVWGGFLRRVGWRGGGLGGERTWLSRVAVMFRVVRMGDG